MEGREGGEAARISVIVSLLGYNMNFSAMSETRGSFWNSSAYLRRRLDSVKINHFSTTCNKDSGTCSRKALVTEDVILACLGPS